MITTTKKEITYTDEVIKDVTCDKCGQSCTGEDDFIYQVRIDTGYFVHDRKFLATSGIGYTKELCENCIKLVEDILGEL